MPCGGPGRESERSNITGLAYAQPSLDSFAAADGLFGHKREDGTEIPHCFACPGPTAGCELRETLTLG